jgi:predicted RNase H-like nuclease (RuvC/YqgF family)
LAQDRSAEKAMQRLARVARRHGNWALVSLAVRVRLDAFTKVKVMMDKMLAELQKQQKEEYQKWETCKKDIDETEDSIKESEWTKEDLDEKNKALTNTIQQLEEEIGQLKKDVADNEVSLKQAGENRHAENEVFQTSVSDQRAAIEILTKALARLRQFYGKDEALVQQDPGAEMAPPPPAPKDYEKSASSGGVVQVLMKVISEAKAAEAEMQVDEQHSQEEYAALVRDTTASIEADRLAISQKESQVAEAQSELEETKAAQASNDQELEKLQALLRAHHADCDYILKFFDVRQKSRAEEMDAIQDAKAILSGANFGK